MLAGLKAIPADLYEAASIGSARAIQEFWFGITYLLKMIIAATVILRVIGLVNSPDILLIITGGGPVRASQVLSLYACIKANKEFNFGYASAISVVMFVLLMAFAYGYVKLSNAMKE